MRSALVFAPFFAACTLTPSGFIEEYARGLCTAQSSCESEYFQGQYASIQACVDDALVYYTEGYYDDCSFNSTIARNCIDELGTFADTCDETTADTDTCYEVFSGC